MTSLISRRMKTVYFVRPIGGGQVKIGSSLTPYARFKFFAEWAPVPMELAAKAPGRMCDEIFIHRIFHETRMHGEWFAPSERLSALIDEIATTGELPDWCIAPPEEQTLDVGRAYRRAEKMQRLSDWRLVRDAPA